MLKLCKRCGVETERRFCDGKCKTCRNRLNRKWKETNPEKYDESNRESTRRWQAENPGKAKELWRRWKKDNAGVVNAINTKRYAAVMQRLPRWADLSKIAVLYKKAKEMERITGEAWHVDHVIPLQGVRVSGLHVHTNLQVLPARENIRKLNSFEVV